jgi:hypothetical protein
MNAKDLLAPTVEFLKTRSDFELAVIRRNLDHILKLVDDIIASRRERPDGA